MRIVFPILCLFVAIGCGFAQGNSAPVTLSPDQQAIRANAEAFVADFNKGDAKGVAALWTPEGEMSVDGEAIGVGREAIAAKYTEYFAANPKATIQVEIDTIRMLGPNMAVERGRSEVVDDEDDFVVDAYRLVHVKQDGKWLIATADVQQEVVEPPFDWKAELGFLAGKWKAEEGDWGVETEFEWVAGGNFLKRTFSIKDGDQEQRTGTQVIGWDAREQAITSWTFGAEGGHSRGWWSRHDNQWLIETEGVSAEGEIVNATNIITFLDDDNFRWQSTGRSIEGSPLPDTDSVRVTRVSVDKK
jgi:uncharacterized protein (TIGR02246 family)